jgi:hypothetical protein
MGIVLLVVKFVSSLGEVLPTVERLIGLFITEYQKHKNNSLDKSYETAKKEVLDSIHPPVPTSGVYQSSDRSTQKVDGSSGLPSSSKTIP